MLIFCPRCNGTLPERFLNQPRNEGVCPTCITRLSISVFPALYRPTAKIDPQSLLTVEGEATCFEHASKRAVAVCHKCGRFLCALCEVQVAGEIWCPSCLLPGANSAPVQALEQRRTLYDSVALALATLPALLVYPPIVTAPISIYLSIRYWKKPSSIVPRGKWRFVAALLFALLELCLFALGVWSIIMVQRRSSVVSPK